MPGQRLPDIRIRRLPDRKAAGEGRPHIEALRNQSMGLVEIGGLLLLAERSLIQRLPTQAPAFELQARGVLGEADDLRQASRILVQVQVRPALGAGQALQ